MRWCVFCEMWLEYEYSSAALFVCMALCDLTVQRDGEEDRCVIRSRTCASPPVSVQFICTQSLHSCVCLPLTSATSDWPSLTVCLSSYLQSTVVHWDNTHTHTHTHTFTQRKATHPTLLYKSHLNRTNMRSSLVWPPAENTNELYRKDCHLIC